MSVLIYSFVYRAFPQCQLTLVRRQVHTVMQNEALFLSPKPLSRQNLKGTASSLCRVYSPPPYTISSSFSFFNTLLSCLSFSVLEEEHTRICPIHAGFQRLPSDRTVIIFYLSSCIYLDVEWPVFRGFSSLVQSSLQAPSLR